MTRLLICGSRFSVWQWVQNVVFTKPIAADWKPNDDWCKAQICMSTANHPMDNWCYVSYVSNGQPNKRSTALSKMSFFHHNFVKREMGRGREWINARSCGRVHMYGNYLSSKNQIMVFGSKLTRWDIKCWRGCMYPKASSAHSPGKSTNGSIPIPLSYTCQ